MRSVAALLLLLAALSPSALASLLAVDFGTEWTKASLVKPGIPFDVLLDKDSKRKMGSSVGWKRDERVFGGEASNAAARFPQTHFPYVKPLLGSTYLPENLTSIYPVIPQSSSQGTFLFPHEGSPAHVPLDSEAASGSALAWTPEELLAMQLLYIKDLAVAAAHGEAVTDLFLTIPSYATQHQRRAYKDAADIAGLNIVGMISEAGGVGLNFALTRKFSNDKPEYHMIFDSGAGKTTATILSFQQVEVPIESTLIAPIKKGKKPPKVRYENVTQITTIAAESEPYLGGINIDDKLRELLIEDFVEKVGRKNGLTVEGVKANARAMRKFWKEAGRVKNILSANSDASTSIESIVDELDYRSRISRAQLEEACAPFSADFVSPVSRVLSASGMKIDQIESVIFFGGNTRVPMVQNAVKEVIPADKIAQNVNTDEAAVLGAAFFGASTGRQFQSKVKLRLQDISPYEIGYSVGSKQSGVVFSKGSNMTARETLAFKEKDDFAVTFAYTGQEHATTSEILKVDVLQPTASTVNMTTQELSDAEIKLNMRVDSRGFLRVANAVMVVPVKPESIGGKFMGLFGGTKEKKVDEDKEDGAERKEEGEQAEDEVVSPKERSIVVTFKEAAAGIKPLTKEAKRLAKKRLQAIDAVEREVVSRAEARNRLEGYLYRLQNLLGSDANSKALQDFSSETEKAELESALSAGFEWMSEQADAANTAGLKEKLEELESLERPIIRRYKEFQGRPKAIDDYQKSMMLSRAFFVDAKRNLTESLAVGNLTKYTEDELDVIENLLKENEVWMTEKMHLQEEANKAMYNDPAVTIAELESRGKALQFLVEPLQKRKAPRPPKPSTTAAAPSPTEAEEPMPTAESEPVTEAEQEPPEPMPIPVHEEL